MNTRLQAAIALAAIGLSAFAFTHDAKACDVSGMPSPGAGPYSPMPAYAQGNDPILASLETTRSSHNKKYANPLQELEPITGLYRFTFTVQGNVVDQGFVTWHADGTEIMNSGKPPITQSFCMGAWEQTGPHSYKLNHWALNWDAAGQTFLGPVNIRENIVLDRSGKTYTGDFTLTQYTPDGKTPTGPTTQGTVSATRVSVDSD
jgi:hypothetical protein